MIARIFMLIALMGLGVSYVPANNVRITDKVKIAGQLGKDTLLLSFPLSWENSWRLGENWDAVYLFFKYKRVGMEEPWYHLQVKADGHYPGAGLTYTPIVSDSTITGMMVYRSANGSGTVNTMMRFVVDINKGDMEHKPSIADFKEGKIEIAVGAIEMVFVPNGPYYLGDGACVGSMLDASGNPIYMASENELTVYELGGSESKKLPSFYPKGYRGFYCMKYELSQEQYTYFLNKVSYNEQKKRIGNNLDKMSVGDYAFSTASKPPFRNGIILEKRRGSGNSVVFGHNLNKEDNVFNGSGDGQTIACNFMTPSDMQAYADWVGLRPLSEMEYEKACRPRNPEIKPLSYECAWSMRYDENKLTTSIKNDGTLNEVSNDGANVNAMARFNAGPLRCGSFARPGNTSQEDAGASFWGIMDLTGNLWEMCASIQSDSSMLSGKYGDGCLNSDVIWWIDTTLHFSEKRRRGSDGDSVQVFHFNHDQVFPYKDKLGHYMTRSICKVLTVVIQTRDSFEVTWDTTVLVPRPAWPDKAYGYGLRGGSFATNDYRYIAVSDRHNMNFFAFEQRRNEEISFRLAMTAEVKNIRTGVIAMNNEKSLDTAVFSVEAPYTIKEIENSIDAPESILYRWEVDSSGKWNVLAEEIRKELILKSLWNNTAEYKTYKFRRKSQTVMGEGYSNVVTLVVPGFLPRLQPKEGVVDQCGGSTPIMAYFSVPVTKVRWLKEDGTLLEETPVGVKSVYSPTRIQFPVSGKYNIKCEVTLNGAVQVVKASVRVETAYGSDFCPGSFVHDGVTYTAKIMPDCRCWMTTDLKTMTSLSVSSPDGGVRMYNWDDLQNEYGEDAPTKPSNICPEGWRLPTVGMASNLVKFDVTKNEFNGLDRGALNAFLDNEILGNYWAVMYATNPGAGEDGHGIYAATPAFLSVDTSGRLIFRKAKLDDESEGFVFMTVRCVKMVNP